MTRYDYLLAQYRQMHQRDDLFHGFSVVQYSGHIEQLLKGMGCTTVLDYGCGKGRQYEDGALASKWGVTVSLYDPGYAPLSAMPGGTFDAVVCTDVLEHVDEQDVGRVLVEIFSKADRAVFLGISCRPAVKVLPNGENAHVTVRDPKWWEQAVRICSSGKPFVLATN